MNLVETKKTTSRLSTSQKYKSIGQKISDWSENKNLSKTEIKIYAKKVFLENGIINFKASDGWYRRWAAKWKTQKESTNIKDTKIIQRPSSSTETKTWKNEKTKADLEFIKWLQDMRRQGNSIDSHSLNNKIVYLLENFKGDSWFFKYGLRLKNETDKCHIMYPSLFKKELVSLSYLTSINHVSKIFKVDRKRVREWCHSIDEKRKKNTSLYLTDDKIDNEIWQWYNKQEIKPNSTEVREKALQLYRTAGFTQINCSNGWYYRWQKRYNLQTATGKKKCEDDKLISWLLGEFECHKSITRTQLLQKASQLIGLDQPSTSWAVRFLKRNMGILQENPDLTKLPNEIEDNIILFKESLKNTINNCDPRKLIAFDEIPLNFEPPGIKRKNMLQKSRFSNCNASLIITCNANGQLLPTAIITKNQVENENCEDFLLLIQEAGINDITSIHNWFSQILKFVEDPIVICDVYEPHLSLKETYDKKGIKFVILPKGSSLKLQPLTRICRIFKKEVEEKWSKMQEGFRWTTGQKYKLPNGLEIFNLVKNTCKIIESQQDCIKEDFINSGFLTTYSIEEDPMIS